MPGNIREKIQEEEFDYQSLLNYLSDYKKPRDKITKMLKAQSIIRIKKGIYIFGKEYRKRPYSREILANLIYGPSYLSLEYALSFYGLIPEKVEILTSVTCRFKKRFTTPVGLFLYKAIPVRAFSAGIDQKEVIADKNFLIARPEKALTDKIMDDRGISIRTIKDMDTYLFQYLRIDQDIFSELDPERFDEYADKYRSRKLQFTVKLLKKIKAERKINE
jgi:hypothetical protein